MNSKLSLVQTLFDLVNAGHTTYDAISKFISDAGHRFHLTEFELREADPKLRDFVIKNNLVIPTIDAYGFTEPFEDFQYSFDRLESYLDLSNLAFDRLEASANEKDSKSLGLSWEDFEKQLRIADSEIIYEQSLITLLTIFEAYISHILQWIFQKDESAQHKIRVNLDFDEILENIDDIVPFLVLKKIEQIRSWEDRIDTIQSKPIQIRVKDKTEYRIIKDSILKRNLLIHNKGIVNNKFLREMSNNDVSDCNLKNEYTIDDRMHINPSYYYQVQEAINSLVKFIDDKVKEKYASDISNKN